MILFFIILSAEIAIAGFRSSKKNIVRLICNFGCILIAAAASLIVAKCLSNSITDFTSADLTFGGIISKKDSGRFIEIIDPFLNGTAATVLFVVIYWVLKGISLLIVKLVLKEESKTGFKPLHMLYGLVIGLLCAGFTLMPYTGILQAVPGKSAASAAGDIVSEFAGKTTGTLTRLVLGSPAEKVSRYMGVGLLTNMYFNACTTARTSEGSECMKDFLYPYMENLEDIAAIADEDSYLSKKIMGGSKALHAFGETKLIKERKKIELLEDAIRNKFPEIKSLPEYKSVAKIAKDVGYMSKIAGIIEKSLPVDQRSDLINAMRSQDLDIEDKNIEKLADYLYSMDRADFYVREFFPMMFNNGDLIMRPYDDLESTRNGFIIVLKGLMRIRRNAASGYMSEYELYDALETVKYSNFFTRDGYERMLDVVRGMSGIGEIPGYLY